MPGVEPLVLQMLLLGDSHAHLLMPAFVESGHKIFSKVYNVGAGNCHAAVNVRNDERCNRQITGALKRLDSFNGIKYAVITGWNMSVTDDNIQSYIEGYSKLFRALISKSIMPIFIIDNPTLLKSPQSCRITHYKSKLRKMLTYVDSICSDLTKDDFVINNIYTNMIKSLQNKHSKSVQFVNPFDDICPELSCPMWQDDMFLYSDKGYLSKAAAHRTVEYILKDI